MVKHFIVLCIDCGCCLFAVGVVVFAHVGLLLVGLFDDLLLCLILWLMVLAFLILWWVCVTGVFWLLFMVCC